MAHCHPSPNSLKVPQWNVQGLQNKRPNITQAIMEEGLDLMLLQEKLTLEHSEWGVSGYTVPSLLCSKDCHHGCTVVV